MFQGNENNIINLLGNNNDQLINSLINDSIIIYNDEHGQGQNILFPYNLVKINKFKTKVLTISELELKTLKKQSSSFITKNERQNKSPIKNPNFELNSTFLNFLIKLSQKNNTNIKINYDVVIIDHFDELTTEQMLILLIWISFLKKKINMPRLLLLTSLHLDPYNENNKNNFLKILNLEMLKYINIKLYNNLKNIKKNNSNIQYIPIDINNDLDSILNLTNDVLHIKKNSLFEKGDLALIVTNDIEAKQIKSLYLEKFTIHSKEIQIFPEIFLILKKEDLLKINQINDNNKKYIYIGTPDFGRILCYYTNIRYVIDFCVKETISYRDNFNCFQKKLYYLSQTSIIKNGCLNSKYGIGNHYRIIDKDSFEYLPIVANDNLFTSNLVKSYYITKFCKIDNNISKEMFGTLKYLSLENDYDNIVAKLNLNPDQINILLHFIIFLKLTPYNAIFLFSWIVINNYDIFTGIVLSALLEINISIFNISCLYQYNNNNIENLSENTLSDLRSENNPFQTLLNVYLYFEHEMYSAVNEKKFKNLNNLLISKNKHENFNTTVEGKKIIHDMIKNFSISGIRFLKFLNLIREIKIQYDEIKILITNLPNIKYPYIISSQDKKLDINLQTLSNLIINEFNLIIEKINPTMELSNYEKKIYNKNNYVNNFNYKFLIKNTNLQEIPKIYPLVTKTIKYNINEIMLFTVIKETEVERETW